MEEIRLTKKNERSKYLDVARGISIILMVIGHVLEKGIKRDIIFSFHMPLFIIVSGYFYKERTMKETLKNILIKLILPYTICTIIVDIILYCGEMSFIEITINWLKQLLLSYSYFAEYKFIDNVWPLGVLWFMPLLGGIKVLFAIFKKIANNDEMSLLMLCFLGTTVGYILGIKGYWLPFSFDVAMVSILFYYVGYIFRKYDILTKLISNYKILTIMLIIWIIGIKYSCIELAVRLYTNGLFCFLTAICGSVIVIKISAIISEKTKILSNTLSWYGKNSMYILLFHHAESSLINYDELLTMINSKRILKLYKITLKIAITTIGTICTDRIKKIKNNIAIKRKERSDDGK